MRRCFFLANAVGSLCLPILFNCNLMSMVIFFYYGRLLFSGFSHFSPPPPRAENFARSVLKKKEL